MSEMMNNAATMNRPVTAKDVAAKLGKPLNAVYIGLSRAKDGVNTPGVMLIKRVADEMGYKGKGDVDTCFRCGSIYTKTTNNQHVCPKCGIVRKHEYRRDYMRKARGTNIAGGYYGGNFATKEEETSRMEELRAAGYSNHEIAVKIGRSHYCVLRRIGKQDIELSIQNRNMGQHIRAQKNAARKQYVLNKPIREYNAKVEAHNKMKAEIAKMEAELRPQTPAIEKAAQIKIDFPLVDLRTVQPTALQ